MATKIFKSGNSKAVRLPKDVDLEVGTEVEVRKVDGVYHIVPKRRLVDLTGIVGTMPWLEPLPREDFDDPPRDWHLLYPDES